MRVCGCVKGIVSMQYCKNAIQILMRHLPRVVPDSFK